MKHLEYILGAMIIAGSFCGCETTNSDGSVSRIDPDAVNAAVGAGFGIYNRVKASQQPVYVQPTQYYPYPTP